MNTMSEEEAEALGWSDRFEMEFRGVEIPNLKTLPPEIKVNGETYSHASLVEENARLREALKHAVHWHDQLTPADIARYEAVIAKAEGKA